MVEAHNYFRVVSYTALQLDHNFTFMKSITNYYLFNNHFCYGDN